MMTIQELSLARVGSTWESEDHQRLVRHIAEIERCYQKLLKRAGVRQEYPDLPPSASQAETDGAR